MSNEGMLGVPYETKSYVCIHVFDGTRPVLYVTRPEGDWCLLCGEAHPDDGAMYRVVGIGHVVDQDATLESVLDLVDNEEAERDDVDSVWRRSKF